MNEVLTSDNATEVSWPTQDHRMRVPDTSMLPGSEKAPPAAVGLLKDAVQGAHATIDRVAARAGPAVQRLGESVSAAGQTLQATTDRLRETRDAWVEGARTTVRSRPLVSVGAALALGAVIARVIRVRPRAMPRS